jgi:hypothetical protein
MRTLILLTLLCLPTPAQQSHPNAPTQHPDQAHDATTYHFRLLKDGGEIIVLASDPQDKATIDQIRLHLSHLVGIFSNGKFDDPAFAHGANPPGVATMARLKSDIRYTVSEIDRGGRIRIETASPETTDAVHAFLLFQIIDHKTGDSPAIANNLPKP